MLKINTLTPPIYSENFLRFRHGGLIMFQIVGVVMLAYMGISLFGNPSEPTLTTAESAKSNGNKIVPIVFLVIWNIGVFMMIRQSSKTLIEIKKLKQAADRHAEEGV